MYIPYNSTSCNSTSNTTVQYLSIHHLTQHSGTTHLTGQHIVVHITVELRYLCKIQQHVSVVSIFTYNNVLA